MTRQRSALDLLSQYAAYHRDRRNITTHFFGIPLIVFGVSVLLAKPAFVLGSLALTPAWIAWGLATVWYLTRGNLTLGLAVSLVNGVLTVLAQQVSGGSLASWLGWGLGSFIAGWVIQFIGHYYEGRKPAFVDDLVGLLVGPMFVTAEIMFALGWDRPLLAEIERRVGPTVLRDLAHPAA
ncbi:MULTISPECIES: DUF962 domain-containing protein [unclassified Rhizobacter]|uniref:Mpo1 family 2-hydroxy fatty acid dioxygenase n=1 Tax=unclassified Rhizobacter TaxID=2640088 RepID=UPI0006F3A840|nr:MULTISPECIES: Mpo1-like protein [unclassified Rhizobacter]KQU81332.1 hypothetical protein ASC88_00080 [Rhizobacter sp. Root29]KQW09316.1 hypothetical protein ASC98_24300 [Rhizobacter sp. Root1238]KRB18144.1 hypothetical protein ASE08_24735 [Rhizobacter sp. Root16D2]